MMLIVVCLLIFSACGQQDFSNGQDYYSYDVLGRSAAVSKTVAVFVSYLDIKDKLTGKSADEYSKNAADMIDNMKTLNVNTVYFQVRPYCDALYPSEYFPKSVYVSGDYSKEFLFDPLKIFVDLANKSEISVYAWINPYRVSSTNIKNEEQYLYYKANNMLLQSGDIDYLDPANHDVQALIANGVEEALANYPIDGVIFDDYFYPADMSSDAAAYKIYRENGGNLSQRDYRIAAVSSMLKSVHEKAEKYGKLFGISPAGSIARNADSYGLDIEYLCNNKGYIDFLCPQLYYGFNNQNMPFESVLSEWVNLAKSGNKELVIAVAAYKAGTYDTYAGSGSGEWQGSFNILSKQAESSLAACKGIALFRYDSLFEPEDSVSAFATIERTNLMNTLDGFK